MTKYLKQIKDVIHDQLPMVSDVNIVNRGVAYKLDPNLNGTSRFFKKIEGPNRILALKTTYETDLDFSVGSKGLIFNKEKPNVGDVLLHKGQQYTVTNEIDNIIYINPELRLNIPAKGIFQLIATEIILLNHLFNNTLIIKSINYPITKNDNLQFGDFLVTVQEISEIVNDNEYTCVLTEPVINPLSLTAGYLIANPYYESNSLFLNENISGPFDLAFPISSQFFKDFTLTLSVDLLSQDDTIISNHVLTTSNNISPRIPIFEIPIKPSSLILLERLYGKIDYNGRKVGLGHESMIQWIDTFPTDQVSTWTLDIDAEVAGELIIRLDPNPVQTFQIVAGKQTILINGFANQPARTDKFSIGFKQNATTQIEHYCWIGTLIPNRVATHIKYNIFFDSEELFKDTHILLGSPSIEHSLLNLDICFGTERLDSGYLLGN